MGCYTAERLPDGNEKHGEALRQGQCNSCARLLCRLCNEQPERMLNNDWIAHSPKRVQVAGAPTQ